MGIRKTEADVRRARIANEINSALDDTSMHVVSGGRKGPYTLIVNRLNYQGLTRAIRTLRREFFGGNQGK